ncbi:MAG: helix-turn-helix transcriptional regulator [Catalinimonas sp.]
MFEAGGGVQQVDGDTVHLHPGDVLFIREGHLNAIQKIAPNSGGYFIYVGKDVMPRLVAQPSVLSRMTFSPHLSVSSSMMRWLCRCGRMLVEVPTEISNGPEIREALCKALFTTLSTCWGGGREAKDRSYQITLNFKEALYRECYSHRDVRFYAELLNVSENYLNRCVSSITGKAVKRHIQDMVVSQSKLLLQSGDLTVAQVAARMNFQDASYFSRLFKSVTGLTPRAYASQIMHGLS